jgi:DNA replication protein DnaC
MTSPFEPDGLPYCPACRGARMAYQPPQEGSITGRLVPCLTCAATVQRQRRIARYQRKQARIQAYTQQTGRYARQTFATFEVPHNAPCIQEAYVAARQFAQDTRGWLMLYGAKGTGKSHLAAAVAHAQEGRPEQERLLTMFFVVPALLDLLRSGYRVGDYAELLDLCLTCDLLILDDLGTEYKTDWAAEKLFVILNHRYQAELPTMIVTNCRLADLDPRLYDRLSEDGFVQQVAVVAPSYRQRGSNPGVIVQ